MSKRIFGKPKTHAGSIWDTPAARSPDPHISPYKQHLAEVRERIRIHREKEVAAEAKAAGK